MSDRPKNEEELQRLEAIGVIRASRFVRKYAQSHERVTMETVFEIHRSIFQDAWPEIAGKTRTVELKITDSEHHPPHHIHVPGLIKEASDELDMRISGIRSTESFWLRGGDLSEEQMIMGDKVVEVAAWLHHKITFIHPFQDGNGRTARLAANLVLECYGLVGISIKVERENKNRYRLALAQVDKMNDLEPLKALIYEGLIDRISGIPMFFDGKSKHSL